METIKRIGAMKTIILLLLCFEANAQTYKTLSPDTLSLHTWFPAIHFGDKVYLQNDTIYCDTSELIRCESILALERKYIVQLHEELNKVNVSYATAKYKLDGLTEENIVLNRSLAFQKWEYDKLRKDYEALVTRKKKR